MAHRGAGSVPHTASAGETMGFFDKASEICDLQRGRLVWEIWVSTSPWVKSPWDCFTCMPPAVGSGSIGHVAMGLQTMPFSAGRWESRKDDPRGLPCEAPAQGLRKRKGCRVFHEWQWRWWGDHFRRGFPKSYILATYVAGLSFNTNPQTMVIPQDF